jgi:hypothetical protein
MCCVCVVCPFPICYVLCCAASCLPFPRLCARCCLVPFNRFFVLLVLYICCQRQCNFDCGAPLPFFVPFLPVHPLLNQFLSTQPRLIEITPHTFCINLLIHTEILFPVAAPAVTYLQLFVYNEYFALFQYELLFHSPCYSRTRAIVHRYFSCLVCSNQPMLFK